MVAYSFQKRFIEPILSGLFGNCHVPPKRQTIRAVGRRRHAQPGETLQLYTGMRTKQCRKIGEARCVSVQPITIALNAMVIRVGADMNITDPPYLDEFARSDGFADWSDMCAFWQAEHGDLTRLGPWRGVLIKWEPLH